MAMFDVLFLASFLVSFITLAAAAYAAIQGRVPRSFSILGAWLVFAALYLVVSLTVAFLAPQRVIAAGTPWCFDDWCLTVENAKRVGPKYIVDMEISSRAKRIAQRAGGAWLYVRDENDRHYQPLPDPAAGSLEAELGPGQSIPIRRAFEVPTTIRDLGLVTGHGGSPCTWQILIIGQAGCLFHKEAMIRLPLEY